MLIELARYELIIFKRQLDNDALREKIYALNFQVLRTPIVVVLHRCGSGFSHDDENEKGGGGEELNN